MDRDESNYGFQQFFSYEEYISLLDAAKREGTKRAIDSSQLPQICGCYRYSHKELVILELAEKFDSMDDEEEFYSSFAAEGQPEKNTENHILRMWLEALECKYLLLIFRTVDEECLKCYSCDRELRALEILNYLTAEFGLAKGGAVLAQGHISSMILNVKVADLELKNVMEYFLYKINAYFQECDCIYGKEYAKGHLEEIRRLPCYVKRRIGWAFVKSTDIVPEGRQFLIRTLENESGVCLTAEEETYVMIGCHGEVYNIQRQKFESTYQKSDESLDIFERMMEFIPAVETVPEGEYYSLDELAKICYPRTDQKIYVKELHRPTRVFPANPETEYYFGRPGDYLVVREDDFEDVYIIQRDVFEETYIKHIV